MSYTLEEIRELLTEAYKKGSIGHGSYGIIYQADKQPDRAIKVLGDTKKENKELVDHLFRNIDIIAKVQHRNIVKCFGHSLELRSIVMECALASLHDVLHNNINNTTVNYSIETGVRWFQQLTNAMAFLHNQQLSISLRSLKPTKVLMFEKYRLTKVTDIGLARIKKKTNFSCYTAPEIMNEIQYDSKSDVYSLGAILWEIVHRECYYEFSSCANGHPQVLSVVYENCLQREPLKRPPIDALLEATNKIASFSDVSCMIDCDAEQQLPPSATAEFEQQWADFDRLQLTKQLFDTSANSVDLHSVAYSLNNNQAILTGSWALGTLYRVASPAATVALLEKDPQGIGSQMDLCKFSSTKYIVRTFGIGNLQNGKRFLAMEQTECSLHELLFGQKEPSHLGSKVIHYSIGHGLVWCKCIAEAIHFIQNLRATQQLLTSGSINASHVWLFNNYTVAKISDIHYFELSQISRGNPLMEENSTASTGILESDNYDAGILFWEIIHRKKRKTLKLKQQKNKKTTGNKGIASDSSDAEDSNANNRSPAHCKHRLLELIYERLIGDANRRPPTKIISKYLKILIKQCLSKASHIIQTEPKELDSGSGRPGPSDIDVFELMWERWEVNNLAYQLDVGIIIDVENVAEQLRAERTEIKEIGEGAVGKVYKIDCDGLQVAVKVPKSDDEDYKRELNNFRHFFEKPYIHPSIVSFLGCAKEPPLFIVMECAKSSLKDWLETIKPKEHQSIATGLQWSKQIATAMDYIHSLGLIHRDVKPQNILLFSENLQDAKIADFGLMRDAAPTMTQCVGTRCYMAPEVIMSDQYSTSCDVYSLGAVYWAIFNRSNFKGKATEGSAHETLRKIYSQCLDTIPHNRPTMSAVVQSINSIIIDAFKVDNYLRTTESDDPYHNLWRSWNEIQSKLLCNSKIAARYNEVFVFGGLYGGKSVTSLDVEADSWMEESLKIPRKRSHGVAVVLANDRVLLIGGEDGKQWSRAKLLSVADCLQLNESRGVASASVVDAPILGRSAFNAATVDGGTKVLLTGGRGRSAELLLTDPWRCLHLPNMNEERTHLAMAVDNAKPNQLLVTAGRNSRANGSVCNSTEYFDMHEMRWTFGPEMMEKRCHHAAASLGNRVFVTGGKYSKRAVSYLDNREGHWQTARQHMVRYRWDHHLLAVGDRLFAVGGWHKPAAAMPQSVEIFDQSADAWRQGPSMNEPRWAFQAAVL